MATLKVIVPITIRANPSQAIRGVANRQRSSVDEQKYRIAISKKMIQTTSMSSPCAVRYR